MKSVINTIKFHQKDKVWKMVFYPVNNQIYDASIQIDNVDPIEHLQRSIKWEFQLIWQKKLKT